MEPTKNMTLKNLGYAIRGLAAASSHSMLLAIAGLALAATAHAQGSVEAGAAKSAVCVACHGVTGNSVNPEWPSIAGQPAAYIREQTAMVRDQKRVNALMYPLVVGISDADIADIAAYYAAQTPEGLEADPSYWQAGEKLYRAGDTKRNIPACIACHGPLAKGNLAAGYPGLRAQHSVYTVKQLQDYASENRYRDATDPNKVNATRNSAMMVTIAKRLSAEDIRNLASYLQGLR
jgi:cytochrome c553